MCDDIFADQETGMYTCDFTTNTMLSLQLAFQHYPNPHFLSSLALPCRVAVLMFLCTLAMAIGIVVYCLVRRKVGQGQTPFCVGCNTCSGCQTVSARDTCPSSCTPHSPFLILFLSTFPCSSVHISVLPTLPCLLYNVVELQ